MQPGDVSKQIGLNICILCIQRGVHPNCSLLFCRRIRLSVADLGEPL